VHLMDPIEAMASVRKLLVELQDVYLLPPGPEPSESTYEWLVGWFARDENVERGRALTPLLWLPAGHFICLAQCLKGEGAYTAANALEMGLRVKLQAQVPCKIQVGQKRILTRLVDGPGRTSATHEIRKIYQQISAGDSVVLSAHWAITNLLAHSRDGWTPDQWETSGAIPKTNRLVEVGYELAGAEPPILTPAMASPVAERARRKGAAA